MLIRIIATGNYPDAVPPRLLDALTEAVRSHMAAYGAKGCCVQAEWEPIAAVAQARGEADA